MILSDSTTSRSNVPVEEVTGVPSSQSPRRASIISDIRPEAISLPPSTSSYASSSLAASIVVDPTYEKSAAEVAIAAFLLCPTTGKVMVDDMGASILHIAARNGAGHFIDPILEVSNVMIRDDCGWTPGMVADRCGYDYLVERLNSLEEDTQERETKKPDCLSATLKGDDLVISADGQEVSLPRKYPSLFSST